MANATNQSIPLLVGYPTTVLRDSTDDVTRRLVEVFQIVFDQWQQDLTDAWALRFSPYFFNQLIDRGELTLFQAVPLYLRIERMIQILKIRSSLGSYQYYIAMFELVFGKAARYDFERVSPGFLKIKVGPPVASATRKKIVTGKFPDDTFLVTEAGAFIVDDSLILDTTPDNLGRFAEEIQPAGLKIAFEISG